MSEGAAPEDLDVRLEWPEAEAPAVTRRRVRESSSPRAQPASKSPVLVPQRRRGSAPSGDDIRAQLDALTRMVSAISAADLDHLSHRVEQLAAAAGPEGVGAQLKRTSADVKALGRRMDTLARAVEAQPSGSALGELAGRVDTLARTVESLVVQLGSRRERFDPLRELVAETFTPLHDATHEVRRLTDTVSKSMASRADRQAELQILIQRLASEVREVRRALPVQKADVGTGAADAVMAAVKAALGQSPSSKQTAAKKARAKKTAAKEKPTAKKATARKATARKATARKATARKATPRRSPRSAG
jgi:hypothetical protein